MLLRFYQLLTGAPEHVLQKASRVSAKHRVIVRRLRSEICYYVELEHALNEAEYQKLIWILSTPFDATALSEASKFTESHDQEAATCTIEIGPRLSFSTPFSTNAVAMCKAVGLTSVTRLEMSQRFELQLAPQEDSGVLLTEDVASWSKDVADLFHDRMTQCCYERPLEKLSPGVDDVGMTKASLYEVDILGQGRKALEAVSEIMGLAFDDWDLDYYTDLFVNKIKRNPTNVECFDLAQSNSEHSRHWFFRGRMVIDGEEQPSTLFKMVMGTQAHSNANNVIKFSDNSSAIRGYHITVLRPESPGKPCALMRDSAAYRHIIFTAETHNFPTGVAPFPGATTGTGGRIRDVQATGTGAYVIAGTAGYCFGNLCIEGYDLPWEDKTFTYPPNFAKPLEIAIEASNGASDYGNKFGEPLIAGFVRSFGLRLAPTVGERCEWVKPIMFSGGIGSIDDCHVNKDVAAPGMTVVKLGGPVYRIGVGGGAASSVHVQGDSAADLDFDAVQRGDGEMEQKLNRVVRACAESGIKNPIRSIHDQGAGGNGNVLKELVEPAGATIYADSFELGDVSVGALELWGAEYQESNAALVWDCDSLRDICKREKCPVSFVGSVTGDGKIKLVDFGRSDSTASYDSAADDGAVPAKKQKSIAMPLPVDLELAHVLGSMPSKVFNLAHRPRPAEHQAAACFSVAAVLDADGVTIASALDRVLRLPSVASKRYLTSKVDRSVTGLIAQQQCVGPLHTPLADVAVIALSHVGEPLGAATSIGEQPIKTLVDPARGARMSVGESLTNLVFAAITDLRDVKCSGNWMWAAKLPGEGAALFDACKAMCALMAELGIAIDGGKDSLSMAARVGRDIVKAPGSLVISSYAPCPDVTLTVTPDLKCPDGKGTLLYINLSKSQESARLGGSALAQCYGMIGDDSPDLDDSDLFVRAFGAVQTLVRGHLLQAGHDVSDGGVLVALLEMAFAGNCGVEVTIPYKGSTLAGLFHEELGVLLEVSASDYDQVCNVLRSAGVGFIQIGHSVGDSGNIVVSAADDAVKEVVIDSTVAALRDVWEETSFQLEMRQTERKCVEQERVGMKKRKAPSYRLTFDPAVCPSPAATLPSTLPGRPRVAVIREEGSNGDREMAAAFDLAGFETWDICMQDLCSGAVTSLNDFRGAAFVGGFSYADVLGSAKGWAAAILFNPSVKRLFEEFFARTDTFSLGVCNGCQLMTLLGWVGRDVANEEAALTNGHANGDEAVLAKTDGVRGHQGVFMQHNNSGRYESRFTTVGIHGSPAIMFKGMAGSVLGIWVAHGEGKMSFRTDELQASIFADNLVPLRYVDDDGQPTMEYPMNPNGSPRGAAALCSADGRHLAMMPHPERCVLPWQWPWMPRAWRTSLKASPWLRMFQNAFEWCSL